MEIENNEQACYKSEQTAAAENNIGSTNLEASLGKFKNANALLEAYNSLQSEFTKRCQKVKELEAKIEEADKAKAPAKSSLSNIANETEEQILKNYLKKVLSAKADALILDGEGTKLKTPVTRPKSIEEAGKLAIEFLAK